MDSFVTGENALLKERFATFRASWCLQGELQLQWKYIYKPSLSRLTDPTLSPETGFTRWADFQWKGLSREALFGLEVELFSVPEINEASA